MTTTWRMPDRGGVRVIENQFIPMADGVRLAVQLWLPEGAERSPVVLEYIPYRKRDRYRAYGRFWGRTLAQHGVAYARLDARGSGDSEGLLADEYLPIEQQDAASAIAWLAGQPWCNGAVGMRGVSWGGFSALQAAALAPPALKAIMPMCASDRRFTDDAHYVGGAFALTGLKWATSFKLVAAGPPDPEITGEGWLAAWKARLAAAPPIAARWLSHQSEDAHWRQGSVAFDWAAIRCPVYAVGGLVDPYTDAIPRLLANLKVPRKGLIGPWAHGYPQPAWPGPALDWAFEEVRWWRHWLAGETTGIMDEPMLRVFIAEATAAEVSPETLPGRWVTESAWPPPSVTPRTFSFVTQGQTPPPAALTLSGDRVVGLAKVEWVPFAPSELPAEQSADDARSLIFDSAPLGASLEILGAPRVRLRFSSDKPRAHVAARLVSVGSDGRAWLVAWGVLDLTHLGGHDALAPLAPGRLNDVNLPLSFTAHRFRAGQRLRLALSESLWPLVWPAPDAATLTVAAASLELPLREPPAREAEMPIPALPPSEPNPAAWPALEASLTDGVARVTETWPPSEFLLAETGDILSGAGPHVELAMTEGDPLSCRWRAWQTSGYRRPGRDIALATEVTVSADAAAFHVRERLIATLNGETIANVVNDERVPRS